MHIMTPSKHVTNTVVALPLVKKQWNLQLILVLLTYITRFIWILVLAICIWKQNQYIMIPYSKIASGKRDTDKSNKGIMVA